jgi:HlyD family secretion protein
LHLCIANHQQHSMQPKHFNQYIILLLSLFLASCGSKELTVKPIRKDITQAVYASGKLFPLEYRKVVSSLPGYLDKIYVSVGDTVEVGDPLFKVKNESSEFAVRTALNNLALAQSYASSNSDYLRTFKKELQAAKEKFKLDSLQFIRYQALRKDNAGTQQQLDNLRTQLAVSKDTYQKADAAYLAALQKTNTDLENAQNAVAAAKSQQSDFVIKATSKAVIFDILLKEGEYCAPQIPIVEMGSPTDYEVELAIDETDLNFVFKGQQVVFSSEAFGETVFTGTIKQVYPKITAANKSIKATATIQLPPATKIYAGSTIEANIIYKTVKGALVIPKIFVKTDSVMLKSEKQFRKVKTGVSDVEFIEIISGISETDELVKPK